MEEKDWLGRQFEENRGHLRAVAYRMLGSLSEADDAVQETWLRLNRSDTAAIENLGGWLTTVVGRICLDMLRTRASRREDSLEMRIPDPILSREDQIDPERQALMADSVGIALLVVLETLAPQERLAFVLHDMFAVPFEEIARIVGCSSAAARQMASRARRRVRGAAPAPDADLGRQRKVVDAFIAAVHDGNMEELLKVLDPDVVLHTDGAAEALREIQGAAVVAQRALFFSRLVGSVRQVIVNGALGLLSFRPSGEIFSLMAFTVRGDRIVEMDVIHDAERLKRLNLESS
jgi:RNA polymerase sigma factor (sigma-70 family)